MEQKYIKKMIYTSMALSLMSMAGMVISPALSDISVYFKNIPYSYIQMLVTVPSICMIPSSLLSTNIKKYLSYKQIYMICLLILLIGGLLPIVCKQFIIIFICRTLIGIAIGLLTPINTSMITTYLKEDQKSKVLGLNSAVESIGGAFMVILSGFLASISWEVCFLVYLISLVPIFFVLFIFENHFDMQYEQMHTKIQINKKLIFYTLILCIYMTFLNVFSTNISALMQENKIGNSFLSGIIVALYLLSGFVCGLFFDKINKFLKKNTFVCGIVLCAVGLLILSFSKHEMGLVIGSLISGFGMGQVTPASLTIASSLLEDNQTFSISMILSGSRIGQFFTTLIYLPVIHIWTLQVHMSYFISAIGLFLVASIVFIYERMFVI